jgi:type I restriction enzyme S subunit
MPGWKTEKLGAVCQIIGGGTPSRQKPEFFGGLINWATPTDVTALDGIYISSSKERITEEGLKSSSAKILPPRAVLMTSRATIGYAAVATEEFSTNQGFANFICGEEIYPEYLAYWLLTQRLNFIQLAGGTTFKEISKSTLKAYEISYPPIPEQKRIVEILKRAEGIIRLRREQLAKTRALIPALFIDMFGDPATNPKGWKIAPLGDCIESASYGTSKKASEDGEGVPVIRMGNVAYNGDMDLSDLKYIVLDDQEYHKTRLLRGDILFNRTNSRDLVGKTGIWFDDMDAVAASYFIRVRANRNKLNPFYVWAFMNMPYMKKRLFETARGAIGQANINAKELQAFKIPLADMDIQDSFEQKVAEVRVLEQQASDLLQKQEALFQSLLNHTFAGTL